MGELDYKEVWVPKNWCFWTVVLEKTLEHSFTCKELKPVNLKENQLLIFIFGSTDDETSTLWLLDMNCWLPGKDLNAGRIEGRRRQGWQRMRWLDGITDSVDMRLSNLQKIEKDREAWHTAVHGVAKSWTGQRLNSNILLDFFWVLNWMW